jgi:hypothetical protein
MIFQPFVRVLRREYGLGRVRTYFSLSMAATPHPDSSTVTLLIPFRFSTHLILPSIGLP